MGEGPKSDEMKNRRTNLAPVPPDATKPETMNHMGSPGLPHKPEARLGREAQARIGQQLRDMYAKYVQEGVPPQIADLVRRLSEQD
jgi:Anti-sigma factor NepR